MTASLNKRQVNRQRWFDRIENYQQSGLSQKEFCEQHRIGVASFRRWRAIFSHEGKPAAKPVSLLPVSILPAVSVPSLALWFGEELRVEISSRELGWLMEGLDISRVEAHKKVCSPLF